jgi:hypothetical protein
MRMSGFRSAEGRSEAVGAATNLLSSMPPGRPRRTPLPVFARKALAAVLLFLLLGRFPGNRYKRTLEEGIVYDILFVIFTFDDPVPGVNRTLPKISNDRVIMSALTRFHQQGSTCAKSIHGSAPSALNTDKNHFNSQSIKKA